MNFRGVERYSGRVEIFSLGGGGGGLIFFTRG